MFGNQVSLCVVYDTVLSIPGSISSDAVSILQLLYILGVYWAGPDVASTIQPIIPIWTAILALLTCTEKLPSLFHVNI